MNGTLLAVIGATIIFALASYAAYLLWKLRRQTQLQQQYQTLAIEKRNANIFESVNTLCLAGIQGQCDLSEIAIRVYCIMDYVQGEARVDFEQSYPAITELYHIVKDMPRGEARQNMLKQERMRQNLTRQKAEVRLNDAIVSELTLLRQHVQPLNQQIHIQML
ncbi:DUF2489 domain-containing protein [Vibrio sp. V27_P1S3P104]|uniref:DUF2489 domain-containing protein n=1 Tax=unclassified Vibrio TaxID=2614977 RepID=UPI0013724D72|nr:MULTISPECIES: DUF2489 domain-containing protein [unclassified Vibrio]NAW68959.1 DUF2489 domain-containing protein [Vibrio sp. V28_P6S34P95]NAX03869.1 DUF2489 domain-containing protein [Vibrio sp. V30_P3S12P165]NAX34228.1 DUF2489 domain-containing protein [Vibrio sp. V29_P1S30P107]NAX38899.1 DUF2489 domain-containing protein [Vibrio sp. V27_P1S3P104]NAX39238.1 DUF2489 domain-containing protein [Vibrio sp. V26_P1S5P106]